MATKKKGKASRPASKRGAFQKSESKKSETKSEQSSQLFPVVGIGASAGGLEAITELVRGLPSDLGMALVHIHHLDPNHDSMLRELISRESSLSVTEISDGATIEPGHIYVIPPDTVVRIEDGCLRLSARDRSKIPMPIDLFLQTLAQDQRHLAIGVILSGTGSDGSLGIRAIKEHDGITIAQDRSAVHRGMPDSAIASGFVDMTLSPSEIAEELVRLSKDSYLQGRSRDFGNAADEEEQEAFARIFEAVRKETGADFSDYKSMTTSRRVRRRMAFHRLDTVSKYADLLEGSAEESEKLRQDMLIRVTGFFRDSEIFEFLREEVIPKLIRKRATGDSLRIWVPGCATGEEVYSLAIALSEAMEATGRMIPFQIFGTDISESSLQIAREGIYPENIIQQVPDPLLERYFSKRDGNYVIGRSLRDACVFAKQDLTKDPPFSKLDLLSCRNVLIYLEPNLQSRVFTILRYALKAGGILVLGGSETTGASSEAFTPLHRKFRVYEKKKDDGGLPLDLGSLTRNPRTPAKVKNPPVFREKERSIAEQADHVILHQIAPPGVVVNKKLDVVQFRGRTSRYLEPPPGAPSYNIMKMAREGLLAEVRSAVNRVRQSGEPETRRNVRVKLDDDEYIVIDLEVVPLGSGEQESHYLLLFSERPAAESSSAAGETGDVGSASHLKKELGATREYLQAVIEEQETTNEQFRAANEEIQANNEELESLNEEMQTAKEELQSTNEELTTLNEELEIRNRELNTLNNDLTNILTSIEIPVVILDRDLRIRRFNPSAQEKLKLIPADVGRPVSDLRASLEIEGLEETVSMVVETLSLREIPLEGPDGKTQYLQVRPYKTVDNRIDGAILVLLKNRQEP